MDRIRTRSERKLMLVTDDYTFFKVFAQSPTAEGLFLFQVSSVVKAARASGSVPNMQVKLAGEMDILSESTLQVKRKRMTEYPSSVKENVVYTVFKFDDVFKEEVCLSVEHGLRNEVDFDRLKPCLSNNSKSESKEIHSITFHVAALIPM